MTDLLSSSQFWLLISIGFYALGNCRDAPFFR